MLIPIGTVLLFFLSNHQIQYNAEHFNLSVIKRRVPSMFIVFCSFSFFISKAVPTFLDLLWILKKRFDLQFKMSIYSGIFCLPIILWLTSIIFFMDYYSMELWIENIKVLIAKCNDSYNRAGPWGGKDIDGRETRRGEEKLVGESGAGGIWTVKFFFQSLHI